MLWIEWMAKQYAGVVPSRLARFAHVLSLADVFCSWWPYLMVFVSGIFFLFSSEFRLKNLAFEVFSNFLRLLNSKGFSSEFSLLLLTFSLSRYFGLWNHVQGFTVSIVYLFHDLQNILVGLCCAIFPSSLTVNVISFCNSLLQRQCWIPSMEIASSLFVHCAYVRFWICSSPNFNFS